MTIEQQLRTLRNRGEAHVFLGNPQSDGADKTVVEAGNSFSPGVWTCGITVGVWSDGALRVPEQLKSADIEWHFGTKGMFPPLLSSSFVLDQVSIEHHIGTLSGVGSQGVDYCQVGFRNNASQSRDVQPVVVVRDEGPAGARLSGLSWDKSQGIMQIEGGARLVFETRPERVELYPPSAGNDSWVAIVFFAPMAPAGIADLLFKVDHGFSGLRYGGLLEGPKPSLNVLSGLDAVQNAWKNAVPAKIFCPDTRLTEAWSLSSYHILAAMEAGLPRIGAVDYPVFWIRDCVIVLRALDLLGRSDLARIGCNYLAPLTFSGGFGGESDAPSEGIWALYGHYLFSQDKEWLIANYPAIKQRANWCLRMLDTKQILRAVTENRLPAYLHNPAVNVVCLPSSNGLVKSRMDWEDPDFFVNSWTHAGLNCASKAAELCGDHDFAAILSDRAVELKEAIRTHLLPQFGNDRDPISNPYPTGVFDCSEVEFQKAFLKWYEQHRLTPEGLRHPEPLWTYFEIAQTHNAMLLGHTELSWKVLNGILAESPLASVGAFIEGPPNGSESLPFGRSERARGWLHPENALGGNMPHNWSQAEMVNLIRDIFVFETDDEIVLANGVPRHWLVPGATFGVEAFPTRWGTVSYTATVRDGGHIDLNYEGPSNHRLAIK